MLKYGCTIGSLEYKNIINKQSVGCTIDQGLHVNREVTPFKYLEPTYM
jgi:hypothetical protein